MERNAEAKRRNFHLTGWDRIQASQGLVDRKTNNCKVVESVWFRAFLQAIVCGGFSEFIANQKIEARAFDFCWVFFRFLAVLALIAVQSVGPVRTKPR